ncbi:hypothetical protein [Williamsia sp.]|uniref:hypothetical protein n=1 Tax=Williamsia sp. TaxID=1872085 RepID=UPI002F9349F2
MHFGELTPDEQALRDAICSESDPESIQALALEAVRAFRRLNGLDSVLSGDAETWFHIVKRESGDVFLNVSSAMGESARQATVLRHLLAEIRRWRDGDVTRGPADGDDTAGLGDDE